MLARHYSLVVDDGALTGNKRFQSVEKVRDVSVVSMDIKDINVKPGYKCEVRKSPRAPEYEIHMVKAKSGKYDRLPISVTVRRQRKKKRIGQQSNDESDTGTTDNDSKIGSDITDTEKKEMVGIRVIACYNKDGLYYPGNVGKTKDSVYAMVSFNFKKKQKVRTQMIIPISGAIPHPELARGDFVLVRVYNQAKELECYVPGIIEFLPDPRQAPKFYSVLMYNGQTATTMRRHVVKIGRSRFDMAVKYIAHIQQVRLRNESLRSSSATPRSQQSDSQSESRSRNYSRNRRRDSERSSDVFSDRTGSQSGMSSHRSDQSSDRSSQISKGSRRKKKEKYTKRLAKTEERKQRSSSRKRSSHSSGSRSRSNSRSRTNTSRSNTSRSYTSRSESRTSASDRSSRSRSRSKSRSRSRSRSKSRSRSSSRSHTPERPKSRASFRSYSSADSRSRSLSRGSRSSSGSRSRTPTQRSRIQFVGSKSRRRSRSSDSGGSTTPCNSPIERPSNPVPKPRPVSPPLRTNSITGNVTRTDIYGESRSTDTPAQSRLAMVDEKDQMINDLQYQLEKQKRKQLRQEQRLVRQARKLNKIESKLIKNHHNDTLQSEKSRSAVSSSDETDTTPQRKREFTEETSFVEKSYSLTDKQGREAPQGPREGDEVLARWVDDGWYYRGCVRTEKGDNRYVVQDSSGHAEEMAREDILTEDEHKMYTIQPGDFAVGLHPKYVFSYAPAEILDTFYNESAKVEFYDGGIYTVSSEDMYRVSRAKYDEVRQYITEKEKRLVGKSVIARDDDDGTYRLGVVDCHCGLGQLYYVKWLDGMLCKQNANHIYETGTRARVPDDAEHVLAPADDRNALYLPAKIVEPGRTLEFCDGTRSSDVHLQQCYWVSQRYYQNAVEFYQSKKGH